MAPSFVMPVSELWWRIAIKPLPHVARDDVAPYGGIALQMSGARLTLRRGSIVTDNDANPDDPESGGGIYNTPGDAGVVEIFGTSTVSGNRPNDCTGPGCSP